MILNRQKQKQQQPDRSLVLWITGVVCSLALVCAVASWLYSQRSDQQLASVRELQSEAFNRDLSDEERRAKFEQLRSRYEQLSESQQRKLRRERGQAMQERRMDEIRKYFELSDKQRVAFLDKQINEMEQRRKSSKGRGNGFQRPGRPRPPEGRRGGTEAGKQDRRERFRRGFLDATSPADRAKMAEYMKALRERREQRGLPDIRGPRGYSA